MARNAEKAMTTLARWRQSQTGEVQRKRRPYISSECDDLKECEKWRLEIIREISRKVTQIQNAGLGEFRLRDLNDEINKLLREKRHWEFRCAELGGINYRKRFGPRFDFAGKEVPGNRGYKYFGAAKDLPGVRELFETEPPPQQKKSKAELMQNVDTDYYGYRDEDDGVIVELEQEAQQKALHKQLEATGLNEIEIEERIKQIMDREERDDVFEDLSYCGPKKFISHVNVPTSEQIQAEILEKKKQELLALYLNPKQSTQVEQQVDD